MRKLSRREREVLAYIARSGPVTVGEAVVGWGQPRGLARSTVQTYLERLRLKGALARSDIDNLLCYAVTVRREELLAELVDEFVGDTLGGDPQPLLAHLRDRAELSADDLAVLRGIVDAHAARERTTP